MYNLIDFGLVRVASISSATSIADTQFNTDEIIKTIQFCESQNVDVVCFPELSLTSYSCGDLFLSSKLIDDAIQSLDTIRQFSKNKNIIIIVGLPLKHKSRLYNCAAVIFNNNILGVIPKSYLANYNEFYEKRWFSSSFELNDNYIYLFEEQIPFGTNLIFQHHTHSNFSFAVEICEDLWAVSPPSSQHAINGATTIFNLSASNEYLGKNEYRKELIKSHSSKIIAAYIYSNSSSLESTSDTLYSGASFIYENGKLLDQTTRFNFDTQNIICDIDVDFLTTERIRNNSFATNKSDIIYQKIIFKKIKTKTKQIIRNISKTPFVPQETTIRKEVCNEITQIQSTALARRLLKIKCQTVVIGLSGGLDSTLALLSTIQTFKKLKLPLINIICVNMPGFGTTKNTKNNAINLAKEIGTTILEIDITKSVNQHFIDINHPKNQYDITFENAQARMRTMILMDIANQKNGIVIGTGDLSEIALGWNTYNGDQMSMYGLNSGIPKTLIKYLIQWYSEEVFNPKISEILKKILDTPISPELLPTNKDGTINQETEKTIGPYILHDFFLYNMIRCGFPPEKIQKYAEITFDKDFEKSEIKKWLTLFIKRFFTQQFKRNSQPDGIKIGSVSLSQRTDWRMPSDANYENWITKIK